MFEFGEVASDGGRADIELLCECFEAHHPLLGENLPEASLSLGDQHGVACLRG